MVEEKQQVPAIVWWFFAILLFVVIEVVIVVMLFPGQAKELTRAKKQERQLNDDLQVIELGPKLINKARENAVKAKAELSSINILPSGNSRDIIMTSVAKAAADRMIKMSSFKPAAGFSESGNLATESWILECEGPFRELNGFLSQLQKDKILLHPQNFSLKRIKEGEPTMRMVVRIDACTKR